MIVQAASPAPVLTVVQLDEEVPLDRFTDWLGLDLRLVRAWTGEDAGPAADLDGLLVLGGRMSAYDDDRPGLRATRELLAEAARVGVPTLGICLGAQLLAVGAGGKVHVSAPPGRESGIVDVRWRPEAVGDPVMGVLAGGGAGAGGTGVARATPMPTMHDDAVVDLPPGAVWLAASRMYPYQAFRVGSAWGVQFHPEASPALVERWAEIEELPGAEVAEVSAAVAGTDSQVRESGRALAEAFADVVRARAGVMAHTRAVARA